MSTRATAPISTAPPPAASTSRRGAVLAIIAACQLMVVGGRGRWGVEPAESGAVTGLLNAMQQVGGALGLAVLVTVATSASAPIDGMARAFWVASALTATAVVLALVNGRPTPAA